jgi:hypothetical protein
MTVSAGDQIKIFVEIDNDIYLSVSERNQEIGKSLVFKAETSNGGTFENSRPTTIQPRTNSSRNRPISTQRKTPKVTNKNSGLNGVQLAAQLNVTIEGLWEIVDELGIRKRKIGDRFSFEESEAIREFKSRYG